MEKLLPCPFCGASHVLGDGEADDNWFECMTCHARGPRTTTADAIGASRDAWNRRDGALIALAKLGAEVLHYDCVADERRERSGIFEADGFTYARGVLLLADCLLEPYPKDDEQ
jgi:hypothetical protein